MNISIIGAGYVGLVTGVCFADLGFFVQCMDINKERIALCQQGKSPIYEPGLDALLLKNIKNESIEFTTDAKQSIHHGDVIFIAVGTPSNVAGGADLSAVFATAKTIGKHLSHDAIIVNKSTVPVGTAEQVKKIIANELVKRNIQLNFSVVSNPEFLKEGHAIVDFKQPDRIIVGADNEKAFNVMRHIYQVFIEQGDPFLEMDLRSAELTKYAANAMLATRISFINEISNLAENVGANIDYIKKGIGLDPRIGSQFIEPGCGYGGSCFPKDVRALVATALEHNAQTPLLTMVDLANERQKYILFEKINHYYSGHLKGKTIAVWGLAFKPNTDDMREASSRTLIDLLLQSDANVKAYDPAANRVARNIYQASESFSICDNPLAALQDADALAIVTEWQAFRDIEPTSIRQQIKTPVVFDGRNIFSPEIMRKHGFQYFSMGRP